ncbi:MAG TPA: (d)CMP kinase [Longimicrobiales bacterium]|nr:(d)CMP kinase [Longimicrobiales bacterium]
MRERIENGVDEDGTDERGATAGRTLVTLDGPAGVGKSTTARAVARALGYRYLDSGALYRSVTYALLAGGVPADRWSRLTETELDGLGVEVRPRGESVEIRLGDRVLGEELRTEEVTRHVSTVAQVPAVRAWLFRAQRVAASRGRLVADGRDMGTVVFPEARAKVFLTADVEERARRRLGDRGVKEPAGHQLREEAARLGERDWKDENRDVAPLKVPDGALVLDTTDLTFDEQVHRIATYARRAAAGDP